MREKELRLALVCYGGVSLAVYMHGVTKEVWKLSRASLRRKARPEMILPPARDTEAVYAEMLDTMAAEVDVRVLCDIVAGASAGGINGIFLAQAISSGHDMEPLRSLWIDGADSDKLLEAEGAASRFSKMWAMPLIWWARRRGLVMTDMPEAAAREEVSQKLSRLMRSKWFRPPFSGNAFSSMLYDALTAMAAGERTPPLLPPEQPLDLFVTVTDYHGAPETLRLHSPPMIVENEHRLVIGFNDPGGHDPMRPRSLGDRAELAFAARATASFPGAFPPARVGEIDAVVIAKNARWPGRAAFLARIFPGRAVPEAVTLIDGSVLNNRPFGPAIEALAKRPSHREVDRRFVYIDPKPGMHGETAPGSMHLPGFFATVLRSLADIPRQQPINDNLAAIEALSARVRRLRHVVDGMTPAVDAAIERAVGRRFFLFKMTPERLAEWRSRTQTVAAKEAGFAYAAYGQLKFGQVVEAAAARLAAVGGGDTEEVRAAIWIEVRARSFDSPGQAVERGGASSDYVTFLRTFDLDFRLRRLRFVVRRLNTLADQLEDQASRKPVEAFKAALYGLLGPHLARRQADFYGHIAAAAAQVATEPGAALAALGAAMDLKSLDEASDRQLVAMFQTDLPVPVRRALLRAYLGFPFYDIAMLPLSNGDGIDEFDEIKVDRISPDDATSLRGCGGGTLKGAQFNAFGAFFSRAYREHDYLWGRLHAAERMIDIIASTAPDVLDDEQVAGFKAKAFAAIVATEEPFLGDADGLIASLRRECGVAG